MHVGYQLYDGWLTEHAAWENRHRDLSELPAVQGNPRSNQVKPRFRGLEFMILSFCKPADDLESGGCRLTTSLTAPLATLRVAFACLYRAGVDLPKMTWTLPGRPAHQSLGCFFESLVWKPPSLRVLRSMSPHIGPHPQDTPCNGRTYHVTLNPKQKTLNPKP